MSSLDSIRISRVNVLGLDNDRVEIINADELQLLRDVMARTGLAIGANYPWVGGSRFGSFSKPRRGQIKNDILRLTLPINIY